MVNPAQPIAPQGSEASLYPPAGRGEDRHLRGQHRTIGQGCLRRQLGGQRPAFGSQPECDQRRDRDGEGAGHRQVLERDAEQQEGRVAGVREIPEPGVPGEVRGDGDDETRDDGQQLVHPAGDLPRDADAGSDEGGVGGVAEEEAEQLPEDPLRETADAHVDDRLHEVEAESDGRAVEGPVDDVVELVAHDQIEEKHGEAFRHLLEDRRVESRGNRLAGAGYETGVDGVAPEAFED